VVGDALARWGSQEAPEDFFDTLHNRPLGESLFVGLSPKTPEGVQSAKDRMLDFGRSLHLSGPQLNAMVHGGVASWASPLMNLGTAARDEMQHLIGAMPGYLQTNPLWTIPLIPNTTEEYLIDRANTRIGAGMRGKTFSEILEEAEPGGKLMLEAPPYRQSGPSRRGGYRYRSPVSGVDALDANMKRGGFIPDWVRGLSPISTAEADIFRSPRVAIEPTPDTTVRDLLEDARTETGDTAINRLMDFREPRIRFSLPAGARGPRPADPVPFILDDQPDPYTSITTLPIGEEGWTPTLLSDTLGGPVTDQPRTNLDGTMTYLTNEEAMVSDVQRALDRAGRIGPAPPVTSVESQLQALAELSQTDPTIAERYTTPDSQDLIDIKSQVDSFSALQEADQQRMEREAKQEAARQEQVRADNERRAEEAREEQDRARENRERQEAQAERAKAIAKRSKAADDRKAAARAQARADAAAQRERQATIQRQEDNRRRQATERAAKQAEQARKAAIAAAKPTPVRRRRGGRPASRRVWKQPSRGRGR